jgi:hypothetical protein
MYEIWTASNDMMFISNFAQVGTFVEKLKLMCIQQGDLRSIPSAF